MSLCTFLSSNDNEVQCFEECVFFNWEENGGICPFKTLTGHRRAKTEEFYKYDDYEEEEEKYDSIDKTYVNYDYIKSSDI
ncbi:hypothetical protein [Clostridium omnivorum]|uniref:Uncharacterized protein n=1 Tax=Clostridium omnivorum TaxID=1604902 RepID=A0ABQ5NA99_9CLOT|nr:hypothetical protein [Clostridium sp. E14]GLC32126.1 hypothetical protein bsdE14_35360 [Clostridium sp. E14]